MPESVFDKYQVKNYPFVFEGALHVGCIAGGVPVNEKVAEGWIKTKLAPTDDLIRDMVAETMVERGVSAEEAARIVDEMKNLNGFKRDEHGLYIEGRQLKAAIKEASKIAANAGRLSTKGWGTPDNASYKKQIKGWIPEHIFVREDRLPLGVVEPSGIAQRFIASRHGSSIHYEEYVEDAKINFSVETDHDLTEAEWAAIWLTGERNGLGASRSQGFGTYKVTAWERIK